MSEYNVEGRKRSKPDSDYPPFSRIFVLVPKTASESDLRASFSHFGTVEDIWLVKDRITGENRGICYVKFRKASEAARAVEEMNGKCLDSHSRPLKVLISNSRRDGSGRDPCEAERMLRLFVVVPKHFTKDDLHRAFEVYGQIESVRIVSDRGTGESKGLAYVKFFKASDAARALEECDRSFKPKFAEPLFTRSSHRRDFDEYNQGGFDCTSSVRPAYNDSMRYSLFSQGIPYSESRYDASEFREGTLRFFTNSTTTTTTSTGDTRLLVKCRCSISLIHITRLFDLISGLEECRILPTGNQMDSFYLVRYGSESIAAYAREKIHGFQFPSGEIISVSFCDDNVLKNFFTHHQTSFQSQGCNSTFSRTYESSPPVSPYRKIKYTLSSFEDQRFTTVNLSSSDLKTNDTSLLKVLRISATVPIPNDVLRQVFSRFGNLLDAHMNGRNFGFIVYSDAASAGKALEVMNGNDIGGIRIYLSDTSSYTDNVSKRFLI